MSNVRKAGLQVMAGVVGLVAALEVLPAFGAATVEDCQTAWGRAARSYRSSKKIKGPEDDAFKAACELTTSGKKDEGRLEAAIVAIKGMGAEDQDGCVRFATSYLQVKDAEKVCGAATSEDEALRKLVTDNLPAPPWKSKK